MKKGREVKLNWGRLQTQPNNFTKSIKENKINLIFFIDWFVVWVDCLLCRPGSLRSLLLFIQQWLAHPPLLHCSFHNSSNLSITFQDFQNYSILNTQRAAPAATNFFSSSGPFGRAGRKEKKCCWWRAASSSSAVHSKLSIIDSIKFHQ